MGAWRRRKKYRIEQSAEYNEVENVGHYRFTRLIKRELVLMIITILLATSVTIGGSYAIFSNIEKAEKYNVVKTGTLQIAYDDTSTGLGNIISLNGAYPESDIDGQKREPYRFKVTNTGSLNAKYSVKILDDSSMISEDGCGDKLLDKSKIKYSLNTGVPTILSTMADSYIVARGTLAAGESVTFEIRMWIDESAGNEVLGTHYHGKIVVEAGQKESGEIYQMMMKQAVPDDEASEFVTATTGIDFAQAPSDTNGKGVYTLAETKNDPFPVYYFRGAVTTNNVKFAGLCWKIVRTTSTGGTKIVYSGTPDENGACLNQTGDHTVIGTSAFNSMYDSPADVGYMYGNREDYTYQKKDISSLSEEWIYGNDIEWDGEKYILKDTLTSNTSNWSTEWSTIATKYHYTCFSTGNSCIEVNYISSFSPNLFISYLKLKDGKTMEDAKKEMFTNTTNSTIKTKVDTWYQEVMLDYTDILEDTIWCNDRSIDRGPLKSKDEDSSITSGANQNNFTLFGADGRNVRTKRPSVMCSNDNDKFTVSPGNGNGALTYPVALLTADEITLAGHGWDGYSSSSYLYTNQVSWSLSPRNFLSVMPPTILV